MQYTILCHQYSQRRCTFFPNGKPSRTAECKVVVSTGDTSILQLKYSKNDSSKVVIARVVTFQSIITDLDYFESIAIVRNRGVSIKLHNAIDAAERAYLSGRTIECESKLNELLDFLCIEEFKSSNGKKSCHFDDIAIRLLKEDVIELIKAANR